MNRSDYSSLINGRAIHEDKEEVPTVSEQEMLWVSPPSHVPGVIGEDDMKRAFEQIVNCIHLDEDDYGRKGRKCRTIVPDLDSPQSTPSSSRLSSFTHSPITSPYSSIGPSLTASPISPTRRPNGLDLPSRTNRLDSPSRTHMLNSPSRTNMLDPPILISPIPMTTKSFLDDDWLRDRVRFDAKMAQVAGGLVRSSSTPPRSDSLANTLGVAPNGTLFSTNFSNHVPPRDYVCKLCNIPGHWLKDCHLYEPRGGSTGTGKSSHSRTSSMSGVSSSRGQQPPGNYVCRLCGIPGHWIEQCAKFQPKFTKVEPGMKNCTPPINYICNLCNQPGHWIQQCSEFTPMPSFHRRSSPSDRGDFF